MVLLSASVTDKTCLLPPQFPLLCIASTWPWVKDCNFQLCRGVCKKKKKKEADVELLCVGCWVRDSLLPKRKLWAFEHHHFTCSMAISASIYFFFLIIITL